VERGTLQFDDWSKNRRLRSKRLKYILLGFLEYFRPSENNLWPPQKKSAGIFSE
jgi:hypothetical protein